MVSDAAESAVDTVKVGTVSTPETVTPAAVKVLVVEIPLAPTTKPSVLTADDAVKVAADSDPEADT